MKSLLFALATLLSLAAFAETYRWVDKDGTVHYSDQPPQDADSERVQLESPNVYHGTDKGASQRRSHGMDSGRRIEEQQATASAAARNQRCLKARKELTILQQQMPVYRDTEGNLRAQWAGDTYQGERRYVDDAARPSEIERVRRELSASCQRPDDAQEQALARKEWVYSERCAAARVQLEAMERPGARTSEKTLESMRQDVKRHCME